MANYINLIERELQTCYNRASKLKIALEVLSEFKDEVRSQAQPELAAPMKKRAPAIAKGSKLGRRRFGTDMYSRTTQKVLEVMPTLNGPARSAAIIQAVRNTGFEVSDTTLWNVLKGLRDAGTITWDDETRMYALSDKTEGEVK